MTILSCRTIDSPVGPLTLAGSGDVLTNLRMQDQTHVPPGRDRWRADSNAFADVVDQLEAYFAGQLTAFDVALDLGGTDFQRRVWRGLLDIPYGQTRSYGQLAQQLGRPGAARAVGLANGRNPVGIIVPCHRVIGASGALTGYGGGLPRKQALLELERDHHAPRLAFNRA
ncbi:MAG: methylated-DNA--[protein]-cysteine S-methyltransferase [Acidimicrobiales bacterium]